MLYYILTYIKKLMNNDSLDKIDNTNNKDILEYKYDFLLELSNNNYSPETVYNYGRDLSIFEGFLELNRLAFEDVDKRIITHYKGFLRGPVHYLDQLKSINWDINQNALQVTKKLNNSKTLEGLPDVKKVSNYHGEKIGARSINRMLSALRSYLKFLIDFDLKPVPVAPEAIKLIKVERRDSQVAEFYELIKLIECPYNEDENATNKPLEKDLRVGLRNRAMLELLFSTGMRISELLRLNRQDVNNEGKIYVMGKGKKQRFVYLTDRAVYWVYKYLAIREDNEKALFIPYRGGRNGKHGIRVSANYLQEKIAFYRRSLGIVVKTSAHSLRHGFATYLAEQGANAAAIQILLGHESLHTTSRYVHPSDKFAQRTHRDFHPLYDVDNHENDVENQKTKSEEEKKNGPIPDGVY